jgi:hypothetical protein
MTKSLSRRQFLKAAGTSGAAFGFASLFGLPALPALAKPTLPERVMQAAAQTAASATPFTKLAATMPLAAPLAHISMGADGTLWGIDTAGVPYSYDRLSQTWEVYTHQIDAITTTSRWQGTSAPNNGKFALPLVVMGSQITSPLDGSPLALADAFAGLPASFQLGLDGIAEANGKLFLFRHGRYVIADTSTPTNAVSGSPLALTSVANWPLADPAWSAGTIQALGSCFDDPAHTIVHLFNNNSVLVVDLNQGPQGTVTKQERFLDYSNGPFYYLMAAGFSALTFASQNDNFPKYLFQGGVQWETTNDASGDATASYAAVAQAAGWTPVLSQAPSGSADGLWSISNNRAVVNTGSGWQLGPYDASLGDYTAVSTGADGSVFCVTSGGKSWGLRQLQNGSWGGALAVTSNPLAQLEVGDAEHIWFRDVYNNVLRYQNGTISGAKFAATHIAANPDGTLWHTTGDTNAHRFISEGSAPSTSVSVGAAGTVISVASTGFATAFALAQDPASPTADGSPATQLYAYDSTYVWKTPTSYEPEFGLLGLASVMVQNGTTVFITAQHDTASRAVYALDTQTGVPLWSSPAIIPIYAGQTVPPLPTNIMLTYDRVLNLLYVGGGLMLMALDAGTGATVWSLDNTGKNTSGIDAWGEPTIAGNALYVCDRWNRLLLRIDAQASKTAGAAVVQWSIVTSPIEQNPPAGAPLVDNVGGLVYMTSLLGNIIFVEARYPDSGLRRWGDVVNSVNPTEDFLANWTSDSVIGRTNAANGVSPALFVTTGDSVVAMGLNEGGFLNNTFTLPQPPSGPAVTITSSLSYLNDQLFFGDSNGKLYVLNALTMQLVTSTSDGAPEGVTWTGVVGRPELVHTNDSNDGVVVAFARGDANIWYFDPTSGNTISTATDQTRIASLLYDQTHGLLYGCSSNGTSSSSLGQVFALRPDQALQDERSFIIESQLMQDYHSDDEATNSNGNARYQTHVTIVDDNNVPMSNASVKLWAEEDGTVVSVDGGDAVTIGPDTPTLFTTDNSGSFTVISGGFVSDGSDATDMFTATLQVWAAFMDPSERIVITPDAEFHGRVATTTASGQTDASQADPTGIDLSSTQSYDGTPLFASDAANQSLANTVAGAVTQVTGAVGVGSVSATLRRTLGGRLLPKQVSATPSKYHAYTDLPGMGYSPVSALVSMGLNPTTPLGISFTANGSQTLFQTHTPGEAADLIDNMPNPATSGELGGFLSDIRSAWKKIKSEALKVEQAVVSIAKDVYVGITYIENNVTKSIKALATDIKDAMATIGAIFVQLEKLAKNAIEALSILLHFDEFIKTQQFIKGYYTTMIGRLKGDLDSGFAKALDYLGPCSTNPNDDRLCNHVTDEFAKMIAKLQGNAPTTGVGSSSGSWGSYTAGTSPHSTMSVAPVGSSAPKKSVAVQGMWAAHKSRQNAAATTTPTTLGDAEGDIVSALEGLFSSDLFGNLDGITGQFTAGISVKSPQAFFDGLFADILGLIEVAILAGIDIGYGVVNAVAGVTDQIAQLFAGGGEFYIPIITPLWNKLVAKLGLPQLHIMDLITLIAAIPTTLIYRVLSGRWLSQDASTLDLAAVGVKAPQWLTNAEGIITAMITLFNGIVNAISDAFSALIDPSLASLFPTPPWVTIAGYANIALMMIGPVYTAVQQNADPLYLMVIGLNVLSALMSLFWGKVKNGAGLGQFISWLLSLFTLIVQWIADGTEAQPWETIASDIISNIPGCLAPLKYVEDPDTKLVPPIADLGCAVAAAAFSLAGTIEGWSDDSKPDPKEYRLLLPTVTR